MPVSTPSYLYNASGVRIAKGTISSWSCDTSLNGFTPTTAYVLGPGGQQLSELASTAGAWHWAHTNVYAAGSQIATYNADPSAQTEGALYFHLADWLTGSPATGLRRWGGLGTRRQSTDYAGYPCITFTGLPYGNGLTPATVPCLAPSQDPTEHHFTGKERDTESGNDYFGARYYASSMGRFMSPDPSGLSFANLGDPQSLNLYAYARNNPLINTDPTGLDCVYANDDDNGVESIDHNSNSDECGQNGGTWRDGWVGSGQVSFGDDGNVNIAPVGKACVQAAMRGMIAQTEGTDSLPNGGYGSLAQGGTVSSAPPGMNNLVGMNSSDVNLDPSSLSGHPNIMVHLPRKDGSFIPTSAFGRYQIMSRTAAGYGFTDFSAAGQDAAADTLMNHRNMVTPAMNGDLSTAISRGANEWASLPGNDYGQGGKSMAAAQAAYNQSMASASECQ